MTIAENLATVQQKIASACKKSGRDPSEITLLVISKTQSASTIEKAYEAGVTYFGENRVEEAQEKWHGLFFKDNASLHMVGTVQSRKTDDVTELFNWVHSVDRTKLAKKLDKSAEKKNKRINILIEVNVSGEENKSGFALNNYFENNDTKQLDAFLTELNEITKLKNIDIKGLMTMAPLVEKEATRYVFQRVKKIQTILKSKFPSADWSALSMGMTNDYEIAIEEGATIVRIGTAIFGPPNYS